LSTNPYAPPKAAVADVVPAEDVGLPFFAVSKKKLVIMSIATGTLYQLVWFYSNWRQIQRRGEIAAPFMRTLFAPFFCYALFSRVRRYRKELPSGRLQAGLLALGWLATTLGGAFLSLFYDGDVRSLAIALYVVSLFLSHASVLFMLPVQNAAETINRVEAPDHDPNDRFTVWNWIWGVFFGFLAVANIAVVLATF